MELILILCVKIYLQKKARRHEASTLISASNNFLGLFKWLNVAGAVRSAPDKVNVFYEYMRLI